MLTRLIIFERNHRSSEVDEVTLTEVEVKYETITNEGKRPEAQGRGASLRVDDYFGQFSLGGPS